MPPRGSKIDRLSTVERKIDALQRQLARLEVRPANAPTVRAGRMIGKLTSTLSAGATSTVDGEWWDGAAVGANSITITARDYFLMPDQTLDTDTKILAEFMHDSEWWITNHRQLEYMTVALGTFDTGQNSATIPFTLHSFTSPQTDGFSIDGSNRVVIKYAGLYGFDFYAKNVNASGAAASWTATLTSVGGTFSGGVTVAASLIAGAIPETRSTSGGIMAADNATVTATYTYSGAEVPATTGDIFLRLWSINLRPRP